VRAYLLAIALFSQHLVACATLADAAPGDENLPNAEAGPYRPLRKGELGGLLSAPNVVADDKTLARDATVIDADGDPSTFPVIGYFTANLNGQQIDSLPMGIVRRVAFDGRSFEREATVVLEPTEPWEYEQITSPSAIGVGAEVFLYYASGRGIGLAKSSDSLTFTKVNGSPLFDPDSTGLVLGIAETGWDAGKTPDNPSVISLGDEGFAMFYDVAWESGGRAIGEARSLDGFHWQRVGEGPVLVPGESGEEAYDDRWVGAPCAVAGESALGRPLLRLYYSAESTAGVKTIGMAARYEDGPFERAVSPVFGAGSSRGPQQPSVIVFEGFSFLFATQEKSGTQEDPVVAAGVAPAQAALPPPTEAE
jgi:hypothetical protein